VISANLFPYLVGLAAFLFVALIAYGRFLNSEEGQVFAFMVIVVAAAEVVVGLALITQIFRLGRELDVDELNEMSE
jgi:NADH-quinone oxidoreductase subunit K